MKAAPGPSSRQYGFTLLELIIVIAVFSLVSVMAYGGLNNVLKAREGIERNHQIAATLQRAYLRLREDFQQIQPRTVRDEFGDPESAVFATYEDRVTFTTSGWRNPAGHARSTMQRVTWALEDGRLVRSHYRALDQAPRTEPVTMEVLPGVEELRFRYLDGAREWYEEWPPGITTVSDTEASPEPPLAVEITLETEQWGELVLLFATGSQVLLPSGGVGGGGGPSVGPGLVGSGEDPLP